MMYDLVVEPTFYEHVNELESVILANQKKAKNKQTQEKKIVLKS